MSMTSPTKQWGPIWSGHTWSLRSNSQNNIYYNSSGSFLICGVSSLSLTLFWISKKSLTLILQIDENQNIQEPKIKKIWHWLFSSCLPSRVHGGLEAKRSSIRGDSGSKVSDTNRTSFDGNATFIVIPGTRGRPAAVPDPQRESDPPLHIHRQTFFFFSRIGSNEPSARFPFIERNSNEDYYNPGYLFLWFPNFFFSL